MLSPYLPAGLEVGGQDGPTRAVGAFKRMLLAQQMHPGQKVPLDAIANSRSLSRTPVREAMRRLEMEGFVLALPNRGFVVQHIGSEEMIHIFDARRCIEGFTMVTATEQRSKQFLQELIELQAVYARVLSGSPNRRRLGMLADKAFHMRIAERSSNPHLIRVLANLFDRLIFTRPLDGFPVERMEQAVAEHRTILAAMKRGDTDGARRAILNHIEAGSVSIIEHLKLVEQTALAI